MANLICLVSFALVVSSLLVQAAPFYPFVVHEQKYRCRPRRPYRINGELDKILMSIKDSLAPGELFELLEEAESDDMIGDIEVGEILALKEVTPAKCNLNEFNRRRFLSEINRGSPAGSTIAYYDKIFTKLCTSGAGGRVAADEAVAATDEDRVIIGNVTAYLKNKANDPSDSEVRRAGEKYIKSLPGTIDFVVDARRARILDACNHVQDVKWLVSEYSSVTLDEKLFTDTKMCAIYRASYNKKEVRIPNEMMKKVAKKIQAISDAMPMKLWAFTAFLGFVIASPYLITRWVGNQLFGSIDRNSDNPRYKVHPVKYLRLKDGAYVEKEGRRKKSSRRQRLEVINEGRE